MCKYDKNYEPRFWQMCTDFELCVCNCVNTIRNLNRALRRVHIYDNNSDPRCLQMCTDFELCFSQLCKYDEKFESRPLCWSASGKYRPCYLVVQQRGFMMIKEETLDLSCRVFGKWMTVTPRKHSALRIWTRCAKQLRSLSRTFPVGGMLS